MKENYKLDRELLFKNNIREITSISLDSDYKVDKGVISGDFIISGEYKIHEVSINKECFNYKIPFNHNIKDDIDEDTINIEIINFIYDYKKDELIVNIEYDLIGSRKDVLLFDDEKSLDDFLRDKEVEVIDDRIEEIKEMVNDEEKNETNISNNNEIEEDTKLTVQAENPKIDEHLEIEDNKELRQNIDSDEILSNVKTMTNNFVTYKIHIVSNTDTIESIVLKYNINIEDLKEYNDISNIKHNDKIIIPLRHE